MRRWGPSSYRPREGEIVIAKRIEEGIREVMQAMAYYSGIVDTVLAVYDQSKQKRAACPTFSLDFRSRSGR